MTNNNVTEKKNILTNKDLNRVVYRWFMATELSNSYERLQALAFCNALAPALRKIHKDDAQYEEALKRHLEFYNSEGTFGTVIHGISLSMEESIANNETIEGSMITGIKTGLMGPIAGIGDTLIWGTMKPIILALACSFALEGNVLGAIIPILHPIIILVIMLSLIKLGYTVGKQSVVNLMKSGMINTIITGSSILGLFMMGALSSTYVKLTTPLSFAFDNAAAPIVIQDIINQILPGLLPLCAIFGVYFYFTKKGQNYNVVLFGILAISMVGAFLGVLG